MQMFELEGNQLKINFEMYNDVKELSSLCHDLLESEYETIEIYFSDVVFMIGSCHVGILLMTAVVADRKKKQLVISCNGRLARTFTMLGGHKLNIHVRETDVGGISEVVG